MTSADLYMVLGLVLVVFAIPAVVSAVVDSRPPRIAAVIAVIGGGFMVLALQQRAYTLNEIPAAFGRVLGHFFN